MHGGGKHHSFGDAGRHRFSLVDPAIAFEHEPDREPVDLKGQTATGPIQRRFGSSVVAQQTLGRMKADGSVAACGMAQGLELPVNGTTDAHS